MSPPRSNTQRPPPPLVRQLSLQQLPLQSPPAPAPLAGASRRGLLRRQRSAEDDRPITRLLHSALQVTASALGPGFLADASPPPLPPPKPKRLRPVRVAWAELRKATPEAAEAVSVVAQRVGLSKPNNNARPPTCLPALARANLDIFLAHSGLVQCITSTLTSDPPAVPTPAAVPSSPSPREPCRPAPLSPLPNRPVLPSSAPTTTSRRVNFRSAALRVINRSLSDSSAPELRPPVSDTRTFRVLSAPAHRPTSLAVPPRPLLRSLSRRGPVQNCVDNNERSGLEPLMTGSAERNIRSAPPRRRFKTANAARKKGGSRRGEESSGDDEVDDPVPVCHPSRVCNSAGPTRGRRGLHIGAEIVTMVSLVSPAVSSDSEDDRSPRPLASPTPTITTTRTVSHASPTSQADGNSHSMAALSSVIVCARKITKSVSFQTRGSVPELVRRASTQLALAVTAASTPPSVSSDAATSSPVVSQQVSDKQQDEKSQKEDTKVKKKLLRTKSSFIKPTSGCSVRDNDKDGVTILAAGTNGTTLSPPDSGGGVEEVVSDVTSTTRLPLGAPSPVSPARPSSPICTQEDQNVDEDGTPRPQFETPKEKECWQLYRKMCEKGLTVSFDTVLRGMLTPTEYRLRRGALLSTC